MATLKEQIQKIYEISKEVTSAHPLITNLWFKLENIPVSELEEMAKEVDRECDIVKDENDKDVLRVQVHDWRNNEVTIFGYSKPIKLISPKYISEEVTA